MVCDGRNILNGRERGREERVYLKGTRFSLEICSSGGGGGGGGETSQDEGAMLDSS